MFNYTVLGRQYSFALSQQNACSVPHYNGFAFKEYNIIYFTSTIISSLYTNIKTKTNPFYTKTATVYSE